MRILCIIALIFCLHLHAAGQDSSFTLVRTYKGDISDAAMDNLGNLYILSSSGQVRKYNAAGDSVGVYNQLRNYGKLTTIDVSNPLKILLFYRDFSTVVVLDRFLAVIATLNLKNHNILQPSAIGLSYDNNIWIFDEYDSKLKKMNEQGAQLQETADLRTAMEVSIAPQRILNDNGFVYVADSLNGIFVFDNYGSFKRKIPLVQWQSIAVNTNRIYSTSADVITVYNTGTLLQQQYKNPYFTPYSHSFIMGDKFISFSPQQLQVYTWRLR